MVANRRLGNSARIAVRCPTTDDWSALSVRSSPSYYSLRKRLPLRLAFEQLVSDALELTLIASTSKATKVKKRFLSDMSNSPFFWGTMLRPLLAEVRMGSPKPSTGIFAL
jgi:hypothetical protein